MIFADNAEQTNLNIYGNYLQKIKDSKQTNIAFLKIYIENEELKEVYNSYIETHNNKILNSNFPDSGFDLFCPNDTLVCSISDINFSNFIDMKIKTEMFIFENEKCCPVGFYVYPRSSISKTPLMFANSVGIIDCGYRGNLIGAFRSLQPFTVQKHTRLLQIVYSMKTPIYVVMVNDLNELSTTERNDGGFGSTGK